MGGAVRAVEGMVRRYVLAHRPRLRALRWAILSPTSMGPRPPAGRRGIAAQTMGPIETTVELDVEVRDADTGRSAGTLQVTRIWLPPGSGAPVQEGQLSVQTLTDTQRRELEAIRDEYNALVSDGTSDAEHPDLERLRERTRVLAEQAAVK